MEVTFIGFGEAATALVEGWGSGAGIRAYDRKTDDPATAAAKWADYRRLGVQGCATAAEALAGAALVLCLVTADQAPAAAASGAPLLAPDALRAMDIDTVIIASREFAAEIAREAGTINPALELVPYAELLVPQPDRFEAATIR